MKFKFFSSMSVCAHDFSWPRQRPEGGYYQVCLHCGEEYGYDWDTMRRTVRLNRKAAGAADEPQQRPTGTET